MKLKLKSKSYSKLKYASIDKYNDYYNNVEKLKYLHETGEHYYYNTVLIKPLIEMNNFINDFITIDRDSSFSIISEMHSTLSLEDVYSTKSEIQKVIKDGIVDIELHQLILNLNNAYMYILDIKILDIETILSLYRILTNNVLDYDDQKIREQDVYIGSQFSTRDKGVNPDMIIPLLENMIEVVNDKSFGILHRASLSFIFVYIHPFMDFNGRMSRIIDKIGGHNEIGLSEMIITYKQDYYKVINMVRTSKNETDITSYIEYYMHCTIHNKLFLLFKNDLEVALNAYEVDLTLLELRYIKIIYFMIENIKSKFKARDFMNSVMLVEDKKSRQAYDKMLKVLVNKHVLVVSTGKTNFYYFSDISVDVYNKIQDEYNFMKIV